jgi:hypothetical protein
MDRGQPVMNSGGAAGDWRLALSEKVTRPFEGPNRLLDDVFAVVGNLRDPFVARPSALSAMLKAAR